MSSNTFSFAPLLWLLLFANPITRTTNSAPPSGASLVPNSTLLFHSGAPSYTLRNCSCYAPVRDCNEALANSLCRCHTVLLSALPEMGIREPGRLVIWMKEAWVLEELLNKVVVGHLQLSFCGTRPVDSRYLALPGLQTLRIHSIAPEVPFPNQEIAVPAAAELPVAFEGFFLDFSSFIHVTILDTAVLNGLSALKAYSVVAPPAASLSQHFHRLALPLSHFGTPDNLHNFLITFIY